ncbi:MAG TPA: hypothetical protein VJA21_19285 [Verrucomicrobiae bacterium]
MRFCDFGTFRPSRPSGARAGSRRSERAYMLTEALVYISAVFVLLGAGMIAMYRCIDNSLVLRRNADDIARTMHIGECWRADVRAATNVAWVVNGGEKVLRLDGATRHVEYRYSDGAVYRRFGLGPWGRVLEQVKSSAMGSRGRSRVTAWSWDLELQPRHRGAVGAARMRPLFTFIAVPDAAETR